MPGWKRTCTWIVWGAIAAGGSCAAVFAEGQRSAPAESTQKPALKAGEIDLEKSRVYVYVGKKGFGHEHAVEGKIKSGSINLNADKDLGEIVFDMKSFTADSDKARKYVELEGTTGEEAREKVTETMLGPQVLDVEE